jgi:chromate reductase
VDRDVPSDQHFRLLGWSGSLRRASSSTAILRSLAARLSPDTAMEIHGLGDLPLYNEDWEADPPVAVRAFRERVHASDALLFVTPEYNRGVPGLLKNALDIGSRPGGKSVWAGKPGAVVSVSPGKLGGFGANHHLRQSMVFLDVPMLQQPEAYISGAGKLFDDSGALNDDATREFLNRFLAAYARWVERFAPGAA